MLWQRPKEQMWQDKCNCKNNHSKTQNMGQNPVNDKVLKLQSFHFWDMLMRLHLTIVVMATDPCQSFIHQASSFGSFCSPSQCHIPGCEQALDLMFSTSDGSDSWPVPLQHRPACSGLSSFTSAAISHLWELAAAWSKPSCQEVFQSHVTTRSETVKASN